jgi:hypothetical protein
LIEVHVPELAPEPFQVHTLGFLVGIGCLDVLILPFPPED